MQCPCGESAILYWIKDDIWRAAAGAAVIPGGHLCLNCVGKKIGRSLTLRDLEISFYLKTTQHNSLEFMRQYTQSTVRGACEAAKFPVPAAWSEPMASYVNALKIGEQLARHTSDPEIVLPVLVAEVDRFFPSSQ